MPPAKRNRAFPTGNALLYISLLSVAFGRVRPIQGRTLFLFHRGWVYVKTHLPVLFLLGCIVVGSALFHHLGEPFHHCRVVVSKEGTGFGIQCGDPFHVLRGQRKVEHFQIFLHPLPVGGFWDDHHAPLQMPAENDLCHGFCRILRQFLPAQGL